MDFLLRHGEKCQICFDQRESEAVKTAAGNLKDDIRKTMDVSAGKECGKVKIIVGTLR